MRATKLILAASLLALALSACGGGGGAPATNVPATTTANPTTATVGVLLTDARGAEWDQAFATITSIELIGDNGPVSIFSGRETVDLLSLPDYYELFTVAEGVLPGSFAKIRMFVEQLDLVQVDAMGNEKRRVEATLVGNGKIDVKPLQRFTISGGDALVIELDFDMHKSFKTTETVGGKLILRPVVFARVSSKADFNRLARLTGIVDSIDAESQTLVLCQTMLAANRKYHDDNEDNDDDDDDDDYDDVERCVDVTTDTATGVFSADGLPVGFADVLVDDELTAVGFLRRNDEDDGTEGEEENDDGAGDDDSGDDQKSRHHDRYDDDFSLSAVTLELGENSARYAGTVASAVGTETFDLALAPGQGFETGTLIKTQLFPTTRIFTSTGQELDVLALTPDTTAIVDGVVALGVGENDDLLRAALIVLDLDVTPSETILRGEVLSVDAEDGYLQMLVGTMDRCVDARAADIFLVSSTDGLVSERGILSDVEPGSRADAYGTEGVDGCFIATDILVDADSAPVAGS